MYSDTAELLEFAKAAFDEMALGIEMLVERVFAGMRGIAGDDGERALVGDTWRKWSASSAVSAMTMLAGSPSINAAACGTSPRCPAVRVNRTGQPSPRTARWILVLRPPRERPMPVLSFAEGA